MSFNALDPVGGYIAAGSSAAWIHFCETNTAEEITGFDAVDIVALNLITSDGIKILGPTAQTSTEPRTLELQLNNGVTLKQEFTSIIKKLEDPTADASAATGAENFSEITIQSYLVTPELFAKIDGFTGPMLITVPFGRPLGAGATYGATKYFHALAKRTGRLEWSPKADANSLSMVFVGGTFAATTAGDTAAAALTFGALTPPGETARQPVALTAGEWTTLKSGKYVIGANV